ncbi:MAG: glycosyltransferase family 2 protein [Mastigocoleus sp.]
MSSKTNKTLVSIVIANYNYGSFLATAIESVLNQSYSHFELIVVDDGSIDNSREVIELYGDNITAIFQENAGQGAAFNNGIAHSTGEIICFLDADDYFHPRKLEKVVREFEKHPEWVQIAHGYIKTNSEGVPQRPSSKTLSQGDVRPLLLKWGKYGWMSTSGLSYRRNALEKVLPIPNKPNRDETTCADTYLTATVPFYGEIGCINEPLMYYRTHDTNLYGNVNLSFLIHEREFAANWINRTAEKVGISERFNLDNDADYRTFKLLNSHLNSNSNYQLDSGTLTWSDGAVAPAVGDRIQIVLGNWQILALNFQENISIGRSFRDSTMRLIQRFLYLLFPREGRSILKLGVRGFLQSKSLMIGG